MIHELKAWPEFFDAVKRGAKTFEVRKNDRGFQVGDTLRLIRWQPIPHNEWGGLDVDEQGNFHFQVDGWKRAEIDLIITYKMDGGRFGLAEEWCVLGFKPARSKKVKL